METSDQFWFLSFSQSYLRPQLCSGISPYVTIHSVHLQSVSQRDRTNRVSGQCPINIAILHNVDLWAFREPSTDIAVGESRTFNFTDMKKILHLAAHHHKCICYVACCDKGDMDTQLLHVFQWLFMPVFKS
jgi:hypothetical protein